MAATYAQNEQTLIQKFRNVDHIVIKYVLNNVAGGNLQLAQDTLAALPPDQQAALKEKILKGGKTELTEQQKGLITEFVAIAASSKKSAQKYLENNAWKLEEALNMFFQSGAISEPDDEEIVQEQSQVTTEQPKEQPKQLDELFDVYRAADSTSTETTTAADANHMQVNAIMAFAYVLLFFIFTVENRKDIDVDTSKDPSVFIVAYMIGAKTASYTFTRDEFSKGMKMLG
jgi:hypothetical protein